LFISKTSKTKGKKKVNGCEGRLECEVCGKDKEGGGGG